MFLGWSLPKVFLFGSIRNPRWWQPWCKYITKKNLHDNEKRYIDNHWMVTYKAFIFVWCRNPIWAASIFFLISVTFLWATLFYATYSIKKIAFQSNIRDMLNPSTFYWNVYTKPEKWEVMYLCVRVINFASFFDFDIWFWNCGIVPTVWYFLLFTLFYLLVSHWRWYKCSQVFGVFFNSE